ncbi:MAG TPA: hypothetical protein PLP49_11350 [Anaerohalosphaeraceae bacterium]|nr:hypothetical protein [Anaerohalosphaeraceae bacterium]
MLRKTTRNKILLFLTILLAIGAIAYLMPAFGRVTSKAERIIRIVQLRSWYDQVKSYEQINGKVPESLYEVCSFEGGEIPYIYVNSSRKASSEKQSELIRDPFLFEKEVEYRLLKSNDKWIVIETKSGQHYQSYLMVDCEGRLFKIEQIHN